MLTVLSVSEAREKVLASIKGIKCGEERVPLISALGRILARAYTAPSDLPPFARSTMDGFAVRARDTFGAGESMPALLDITGEVLMGQAPPQPLGAGQCMRIATGGMLPEGSDAVVMVEHTELLTSVMLAVHRAVAPGENTILPGEDMKAGAEVLPAGHRVRAQDIGALAALGQIDVTVMKKPRVAVISTGDELVPPENEPAAGQIRDLNSSILAALVADSGGEATTLGIVPDRAEALLFALKAAKNYELVILSGGSSAGARDHTAAAIGSLGEPGVLFHGVSMRPGKPLIFGVVGGRPYFGLSGNPTSAMVGFLLFVRPLLLQLSGANDTAIPVRARVERNLSSASGREDYVRAVIYEKDGELWARPLFGQSNLISTVVHGNALLRIPQNSEGVEPGEMLEAILL